MLSAAAKVAVTACWALTGPRLSIRANMAPTIANRTNASSTPPSRPASSPASMWANGAPGCPLAFLRQRRFRAADGPSPLSPMAQPAPSTLQIRMTSFGAAGRGRRGMAGKRASEPNRRRISPSATGRHRRRRNANTTSADRGLLPDRTRAWLPQRCIVPLPDYPTAAAGWAAAVEKALQAREMRAAFDLRVRDECRRRPFEGFLMSAKAMITGVGIKCAMFPPPWIDWKATD